MRSLARVAPVAARSVALLPALFLALVPALLATGCAHRTDGALATPEVRTIAVPGTALVFEMVWIAEGSFWIGRDEVSWDEYLVFCDFRERRRTEADGVARPSEPLAVEPFDHGHGVGGKPALGISRNGAATYCRWLSEVAGGAFRLPTEDEWRLACAPRRFEPQRAWCAANSDGTTRAIASGAQDERGLRNTLGNVSEYVSTPFSADEPERAVLLGGSFATPLAEFGDADAIALPRLGFDDDWTLRDSNFPPGVWWVPDGDQLGFRLLATELPR